MCKIKIFAKILQEFCTNSHLYPRTKGVYLKSKEFVELLPRYAVKAVETKAAGGVFSGALAAILSEEIPMWEAIDFARRTAAILVTIIRIQPSAPSFKKHILFLMLTFSG